MPLAVSGGIARGAEGKYPLGPDPRLTTGTLCQRGGTLRYPERIRYCARDVSSSEKDAIIDDYERLGYSIRSHGRGDFKIDHLIPLCVGGSNEASNLWPQHRDVYEQTDKIEQFACELMAQGKLKQREAIDLILGAKNNLGTAAGVEARLDRMRSGRR